MDPRRRKRRRLNYNRSREPNWSPVGSAQQNHGSVSRAGMGRSGGGVATPPPASARRWLNVVHASSRARAARSTSALAARWRSSMRGSGWVHRSEEHTSELQSQSNLVCRLLLEKKKKKKTHHANMRQNEPTATYTSDYAT